MADRIPTAEELDWAHECAAAGDDLAEIGAELGVSTPGLQAQLKVGGPMSPAMQAVAELWAAGCTQEAIAAELGKGGTLSRSAVYMRLRAARGLGYRVRHGSHPSWDAETAHRPTRISDRAPPRPRPEGVTDEVIVRAIAGGSFTDVARKLGISRSLVAGVSRRRLGTVATIRGGAAHG